MTDPTPTPALQRLFTYQLNTLSKLNDLATQAAYAAGCGLSLPEVRTLAAVGAFGTLTVVELALEVNLDKGQASRLARAMVDKGLVERSSPDDDRRVVRLSLTRAGRAMWAKVMPLIERRNAELLAALTPAERMQLQALFDRMLAHERRRTRAGGMQP